jgi:DNA-binding transcriptional regulator YiaG
MNERLEFYIKGHRRLREPYHLKAVGLPNVYLLNGVTFENDPEHGELVSIENMRGLLGAIGLHIIEKPTPMTGAEFRFLRKQMGLTQAALAKPMHVSDQTIANYEKANTRLAGPADPHMRILYMLHVLPPESRADLLKAVAGSLTDAPEKVPEMPRRKIVAGWHESGLAA